MFRKYFDPQLLQRQIQELHLNEYAMKAKVPRNQGSKQMSFFRLDNASSSNVQTLTEGVPISTFRTRTVTEVSVTLQQLGEVSRISDVLGWTSLFNMMEQNIDVMGEEAALKADDISRDALVTATSAQEKFSGGATSWSGLSGSSAANGAAVIQDFLLCRTNLVKSRAPKFGSKYVAIIPPDVLHDLFKASDTKSWMQYQHADKVFKGELADFYGIKFVEATNAFIEGATENVYDAAGSIFSSIVLGRNAFAVSELSGDSATAPKTVIVDRADSANPLLQYMSAGWKSYYNAVVLNVAFFVVLRSKSTYA